jgi:lysophospholipase L1-like esterase
MHVFIGDSITAGKPGVSYVDYINGIGRKVNLGRGGDTTFGLLNRVEKGINTISADSVVIEIGTNDILLPILNTHSSSWHTVVSSLIMRGSKPAIDIEEFSFLYNSILNKLHNQNTICISIPCIGESINSSINQKVNEYNMRIKRSCEQRNIRYIDFNTWQKKQIEPNKNDSTYFVTKSYSDVLMDTLLTTYLGLSMTISKKRGLLTTIDGIHLNKRSAKELSFMIRKEIIINE